MPTQVNIKGSETIEKASVGITVNGAVKTIIFLLNF